MSGPGAGTGAEPQGPGRRWAWLLPALAYAALIAWLSHQSNPLPALTLSVSDKLLHAVEYAGLAGLLGLGLGHATRLGPWRAALLAAALAAAYGVTDEWHQSFVPGRSSEVADALADAAGGLAGGLLAALVLRRPWARTSIRAPWRP